ncbi:MAG: hypothetical protein QFB86_01500 [Patescibacteria group bacterium]|nr:hypothetical protein [Patescibacteria group bacterium]
MSKIQNNQSGFSAIEGLLILAVVAIIGGTGWYVYNANKSTSNTYTTSSRSTTPRSRQTVHTFTQPKDTTTTFKYPNSWTIGNADGPDIGDGTRNVSVNSPNGSELILVSAGAGRGGDCLENEHSTVSYAKKIPNTPNLYVVEWELIGGDTTTVAGLDVLNASSQGAESFTKVGDHPGCIPQYFSFSSAKGNKAGYTFGLQRGNGSRGLNTKDSVMAKQILGSLTLQ